MINGQCPMKNIFCHSSLNITAGLYFKALSTGKWLAIKDTINPAATDNIKR
jgi:hypothetical protein